MNACKYEVDIDLCRQVILREMIGGGNTMKKEVDVSKLRKELVDYYGTAANSGLSAMMMEVCNIEKMSDNEVVRKAKEIGINLHE
jgi:hypothetical protein